MKFAQKRHRQQQQQQQRQHQLSYVYAVSINIYIYIMVIACRISMGVKAGKQPAFERTTMHKRSQETIVKMQNFFLLHASRERDIRTRCYITINDIQRYASM